MLGKEAEEQRSKEAKKQRSRGVEDTILYINMNK